MTSEVWKNIKGFENMYQISSYGRFRSYKSNNWKIIAPSLSSSGYYTYAIYTKSKPKRFQAHRLVAEYFINSSELSKTVNHKDTNKKNNYADNLEWLTIKENLEHADKLGILFNKGESHYKSKLRNEDIFFIRKNKGVIKQQKLANKFKTTQPNISIIQSGINWKNVL
jgi:hypothetical protein